MTAQTGNPKALARGPGRAIAPHTAPELHAHLIAALPRYGFGVEINWDYATRYAA